MEAGRTQVSDESFLRAQLDDSALLCSTVCLHPAYSSIVRGHLPGLQTLDGQRLELVEASRRCGRV
jgi:hypothetical protein